MPTLSIIIPVYKVEDFILECLESIINQWSTNRIEVICINDGTPDSSMEIVEKFVSGLPNIIKTNFLLINQLNQGLSGARNTGLDHAKGKYITFLDSDDRLCDGYIENILSKIDRFMPDLIDFNIIQSNDQVIKIKEKNTLDSVFKSNNWFACARVYSKVLVQNERFIDNVYYEDLAFVPMIYIKSNHTVYINKSLYWYRVNPEGITLNKSKESDVKTILSFKKIYNYYYDLYSFSKNKYIYQVLIHTYFLYCVNNCRRFNLAISLKEKNELNKIIDLNKVDFNNTSKKIVFFITFPVIYLFLYSLYCKIKKIKANS